MGDREGGSSAWRRRQRRLRSWLRHERQTVAMELAAALHHSRDARSEVAHVALRGQKTASSGMRPEPLEEVPKPQGGAVTVGNVAAPVPLLAVPLLAGAAGEAVDARTLSFLLVWSLAQKVEEEEKRKAEAARQVEELRQTSLACGSSMGQRGGGKRGERRRLPEPLPLVASLIVDNSSGMFMADYAGPVPLQCPLRLSAGLCCQASWTLCKACFAGILHLALCSFRGPCRQARRQLCIMAGLDQRDSYVASMVQTAENLIFRSCSSSWSSTFPS